MNHEYIVKATGNPDIQGEMNPMDSLGKCNKELYTMDASDANVNTISRPVTVTLSLLMKV